MKIAASDTVKVKTTQKVIKIGDSLGITLPAKDRRAANIEAGDYVTVTIEPVKPRIQLDYEAFKKQYHQTLKNLSQR